MLRPHFLIAATLLLSAPAALASPSSAPARFRLQGQLQAEPPALGHGRFSLGAQLVPAATRPDSAERFRIALRLDSSGKGTCVPGAEIFRNGFEAP